jgi:hypothetical protein
MPPTFTTVSPVSFLAVVVPNHVLPRTYEWNAAVERTLGKADVLTVTYLGAACRKLMRQDISIAPNPEFTREFNLMRNDATSSYQALQAQYRHRLSCFAHTQSSEPNMQDTQARELCFVIPTHRLREVGATIEEYDEHLWRNGQYVRVAVFDDSSPVNQPKYCPLLEQTRTHQPI